jgi:hypothetical protein
MTDRFLLPLIVLLAGSFGCGVGDMSPVGGDNPRAVASPAMARLRSRQRAPGYDFLLDGSGALRSRAGRFGASAVVTATGRGVRLSHGFDLGVETTSVGREGAGRARGVLAHHAEAQELVLEREDNVEERFLVGPLGVEQSFVVRERLGGPGPLVIEVAFDGLAPERIDGAMDRVLLRDGEGRTRAGYRDLVAADANGRDLVARMEVRGADVALVVEDTEARYPVSVDPLVWTQVDELTAKDGVQDGNFGSSLAMDGDTALFASAAGTYVFTQNGTAWTQQAELVPGGSSVAVDGDTAIVGFPAAASVVADCNEGVAYIYVRNGTTWTQQAAFAGSGCEQLGASVGISGGTAVIGAMGMGSCTPVGCSPTSGVAYILVRNGTQWVQQAQLAPGDGLAFNDFGSAVALSGETAVVGASYNQDSISGPTGGGAAYVFVRGDTTWTQQAEFNDRVYGSSVTINGGTILTSGLDATMQQPAAHVFVQEGTVWAEQAELTAPDGLHSLALSGGIAIVGAPAHQVGNATHQGAAYMFTRSGTNWGPMDVLTASDGADGDYLGWGVAVSGSTAMVGAPSHTVGANLNQGAVYVFHAPPLAANGTACAATSDCKSTFCVDGVCCDTACGGGVATDCQSCLGAMTGGADGTCATITAAAKYTCRPSTGPCAAASVCDGSSPSCSAAVPVPDGGCASSSSSTSSASSSSGPGSFHLTGGCDCRAVPDRGDGRDATRAAWLALGLGLAIGRRRRCRAARS